MLIPDMRFALNLCLPMLRSPEVPVRERPPPPRAITALRGRFVTGGRRGRKGNQGFAFFMAVVCWRLAVGCWRWRLAVGCLAVACWRLAVWLLAGLAVGGGVGGFLAVAVCVCGWFWLLVVWVVGLFGCWRWRLVVGCLVVGCWLLVVGFC